MEASSETKNPDRKPEICKPERPRVHHVALQHPVLDLDPHPASLSVKLSATRLLSAQAIGGAIETPKIVSTTTTTSKDFTLEKVLHIAYGSIVPRTE